MFKKNINWDNYDNEILILISQGVKTINLPNYIPLSMSAIEKRKANIKDQLLKGKGSDKDLVSKAKKNWIVVKYMQTKRLRYIFKRNKCL